MLISLKHDFVFLCNRKCASISIEDMLRRHGDVMVSGPPGLRHTDCRTYRKHVPPWLDETIGRADLETICLVREPVSWLHSWYRFRSRLALRDATHGNHQNSTAGLRFDEFVAAYMQPHPPAFADVGCQFDFVRTADGKIGVDRIFLYEEMDEFVRFMSARVGRSLRIGYRNVSPKENRERYLATVMDRLVKTATSQLRLKSLAERHAAPPRLPGDLLAGLQRFIGADFELYQQVRRARGRSARGASAVSGAMPGGLHADR